VDFRSSEVFPPVGWLRTLDLRMPGAQYIPLPQLMWGAPTLLVRTAGTPMALAPEIGKILREMDAEAPLYQLRSMEDYLALDLGRACFQTLLLGLFAAIALLLTAVGLYGVIAQSVVQRTQEIGIRMAMGATRENMHAMVLRRGAFLSLSGTAIGIFGA